MRFVSMLAAGGLVVAPVAALAKDAPLVSLKRKGKWEVNYDSNSCHLFAAFGEGKEQLSMRITRYQPADSFDLTLIGHPLRQDEPRVPVAVKFLPGTGAALDRTAFVGSVGVGPKFPMITISSLLLYNQDVKADAAPQPVTPEQEAAVTTIQFKLKRRTYQLEVGSMALPMAAMRTCLDDLVQHWGFDPKVQASLPKKAEPITAPDTWLTGKDFPVRSSALMENGIVQFRLDVDETGAVASCSVLRKTNPDSFADLTCALLSKRARFTPALDAAGRPVKSFYVNRVSWTSSVEYP